MLLLTLYISHPSRREHGRQCYDDSSTSFMKNSVLVIGDCGSGKKHLCVALGAQKHLDNFQCHFKNKYYSALVDISLHDYRKISLDSCFSAQSVIVIFDASSPSSLEHLQSLEAVILGPLRSRLDELENNGDATRLESILLVANNVPPQSSTTSSPSSDLPLVLQYARKLTWKYSIEFVQLPFIQPSDKESFVANPLSKALLLTESLDSIVKARDNEAEGETSNHDEDDDQFIEDEDELRGALRILEALECCAWTPESSESQSSIEITSEPSDDISVSTLGSKSLYAVPLLQEKNRLDDQEGDVFDDDEMNLIDICNGIYPPTKPTVSTKSAKELNGLDNLNGVESLMDKLSIFREKMGSMDHETRRKTADSMLMNMMELFDFQDEDEDDHENNTKNENDEYDQLEI